MKKFHLDLSNKNILIDIVKFWSNRVPLAPHAIVAQLVEQLIRNQQVAGSSPASSSIKVSVKHIEDLGGEYLVFIDIERLFGLNSRNAVEKYRAIVSEVQKNGPSIFSIRRDILKNKNIYKNCIKVFGLSNLLKVLNNLKGPKQVVVKYILANNARKIGLNSEVNKARQDARQGSSEEIVCLAVNKKSLQYRFWEVYNLCRDMINDGKTLRVVLNSDMLNQSNYDNANYIYTKEEIKKLYLLNDLLTTQNNPTQLMINEYQRISNNRTYNIEDFVNAWSFNDVVRANNAVDELVNVIRKNEMTPFEAVLFIHYYLTSRFDYKDTYKVEASRVITGVFKGDGIVCSGYASTVKAIIDKLGYPDLECEIQGVAEFETKDNGEIKEIGGHAFNLIYIKDEKYGIQGVFGEDSCNDGRQADFPYGRGFAHCLFSMDAMKKQKVLTGLDIEKTENEGIPIFRIKEVKNEGKMRLIDYNIFTRSRFHHNIGGLDCKISDMQEIKIEDNHFNVQAVIDGKYSPGMYFYQQGSSSSIPLETYERGLKNLSKFICKTEDLEHDFFIKSMANSKIFATCTFEEGATAFNKDVTNTKG